VYAAGYITGTGIHDFGNNVTAAGTFNNSNITLVKYTSAGVAQWARTVTAGSSYSVFNGVSAGSDGSVYAAGYITGTGIYDFGNSVTSAGTFTSGENIVLVKYTSAGVARWARTVTAGSSDSVFYAVSAGADGSVYAAGYMRGSGIYNFGNSVTSAGTFTSGENIVLVKYTSAGAPRWARTVTEGSNYSFFYGVSVGPYGAVYAAGNIYGTGMYNFGNGVVSAGSSSISNLVLVKYTSTGVAQWVQSVIAGSSDSVFYGVSVGPYGAVYAAGHISGTGTYSFGESVTAVGAYNGSNVVLGEIQQLRRVTVGLIREHRK
jgi:hypothetical protein